MILTKLWGTLGPDSEASAGSAFRIAAIVSAAVRRSNARRPVTISCITQPMDLDRHVPVEPRVPRAIDLPHPTRA